MLDSRGRDRALSQTVNEDPSKTIQSDASRADIKHILKRFRETGIVENLNVTEATFADVSELGDFADVMTVARNAETAFMRLPSKVREIFNHDVANWLDTAHDEEKRASLVAAGEIAPEQQPAETPTGDNPDGDAGPGPADPVPE